MGTTAYHTHPEQAPVIQAMLRPETYPDHPPQIIHLQTHISHVFLTGQWVYKIKKQVKFDFLDFTTLNKRRFFCHQEVVLNRRLADDIYQGVVRITSQNGQPVIQGKGPIIEYAVRMREMPQEKMMDRLLKIGQIKKKDIRGLVRILVPFYQQAQTGKGVNFFGRVGLITRNTEENFSETEPYVNRLLDNRTYTQIVSWTRFFLKREKALFKMRVQEGRIRDCHGDLHSANICLDNKIHVYDCIEFNHRFRYSDIACDLAFLSMDLDYHNRQDLSAYLIKEYVRLSGDRELLKLLNFYKAYRACVRAKIHSFSSDSPELTIKEQREHGQIAKKYYRMALEYAQENQTPQVLVVFGLMGTGKTSLAKELSHQTGWPLFSSDEIRKTSTGFSPITRKWEPFGKGIYSKEISSRIYRKMKREARKLLEQGKSVILDGSYKRQSERLALYDLIEKTGARIRFLECRAPKKIIHQRLTQRAQESKTISDGRWELFDQQRRDFDPVEDPIKQFHFPIQTTFPVDRLTSTILQRKIGR